MFPTRGLAKIPTGDYLEEYVVIYVTQCGYAAYFDALPVKTHDASIDARLRILQPGQLSDR
jgi:predicted nucleic-acid-binding Zn-ribbon protein